ncbi:protein of unknown function [Burkholderia multivorans]
MNVPAPVANECSVAVPLVPVIAHGPANTNVTENAPFALAVPEPLPLLHTIVMDAFAIGAPIAAVPLIVADALAGVVDDPLSPPPPHAANVPAANTNVPSWNALDATAFRFLIAFLR